MSASFCSSSSSSLVIMPSGVDLLSVCLWLDPTIVLVAAATLLNIGEKVAERDDCSSSTDEATYDEDECGRQPSRNCVVWRPCRSWNDGVTSEDKCSLSGRDSSSWLSICCSLSSPSGQVENEKDRGDRDGCGALFDGVGMVVCNRDQEDSRCPGLE